MSSPSIAVADWLSSRQRWGGTSRFSSRDRVALSRSKRRPVQDRGTIRRSLGLWLPVQDDRDRYGDLLERVHEEPLPVRGTPCSAAHARPSAAIGRFSVKSDTDVPILTNRPFESSRTGTAIRRLAGRDAKEFVRRHRASAPEHNLRLKSAACGQALEMAGRRKSSSRSALRFSA